MTRNYNLTIALTLTLGVLMVYAAGALVVRAKCGPHRVAVVGLFGLECVCPGGP